MPTLFIFLFKVNIALLLFCAVYYLVLRRLTFYSLNRVYLITAIIFASIYPKIDLTTFLQRHEQMTIPVQNVILSWQAPTKELVSPLSRPDYWYWATLLFWAGAILLALRLVVQVISLLKLYRRSKPATILDHNVRLMTGPAAPFSFWRSIYINPANHNAADLKAILLHEQVHVNGWHTLDILLAEVSSICYWFNPGIWLMKKAIKENIEFITDRKILNKGIEAKAYQYSLVNVSFNTTTPGIVNHFNISTIKKRIIMMNAKKSSCANLTRYAFVIPAVALLLVFSFSNAATNKPVAAKISRAVEPLAAAISNITHDAIAKADTVLNGKATKPATTKTVVKILAAPADTVIFETATVTKADTGKKTKLALRANKAINLSNLDSGNLVVDGKIIKSADLKKIKPDDILAVNIVNAAAAKLLLQPGDKLSFDNDNSVVFVTTKESEEGKKLLARLGDHRQLTNIKITKDGKPQTLSGKDLVLFGKSPATVAITGKGKSSTFYGELREVTADSAITVKGYPTAKSKAQNGLKEVTIKGFTARPDGTAENLQRVTVRAYGQKNLQASKFTTGNATYRSSQTVNRISDKLVVIDGKEASEKELKKLSAFEIDRMVISSDADTIKKFGDKAKYGVVYIYTKKGK